MTALAVFVAAALLGEGLLAPLSNARGYAPTDGVEFMSEVRRLLEKGSPATFASVVAKKASTATAPTQKPAPKPKADAAMPSERKAKAKAARR